MHRYKCDICGCSLDPGEGRLCRECLEDARKKELEAEGLGRHIVEEPGGQMAMRLWEAV